MSGPMPGMLRKPNNFTNHGIFQHNYGQIDWSRSFDSEFDPAGFSIVTEICTDELSSFYSFLGARHNQRPVVEYPMMIGDHFNPYYFYQWYHQRPVIIGYTAGISSPVPLPGGGVYGNTYISEVLNLVDDQSKLHFSNLINMTDFSGMKKQNVEYIIIHKHLEAEFDRITSQPVDLAMLLQIYRKELYFVFEDTHIVVFSIENEPPIIRTLASNCSIIE